jgi:hypothetical protein
LAGSSSSARRYSPKADSRSSPSSRNAAKANRAKASFLEGLAGGEAGADFDRYRDLASIVGEDPLPYGFDRNRESIAALVVYARQQGLLSDDAAADDYFLPLQH